MAISQEQKVDFLLKKIGFTAAKTGNATDATGLNGTLTPKAGFAEAIPSPLVVANSSLWNEADSIPATPPGSDTTQVKVYAPASALRMTVDSTVANNRAFIAYTTYNNTSSARLTNWIDTQFGPDYIIQVFYDDATDSAKKLNAGGSGNNDGWFFDYSAGVLNFNDTNVPSTVTSTNVYIVGFRYVGQTGAPTSGISTFSYLDLTVERNLDVGIQGGISTFRHNVQLLDNASAVFGTDSDGSIKHTGTNLQIFETTGNIQLTNYANDKDVDIKSDDGSGGTALYFKADGSTGETSLYHYGNEKIKTTSTGLSITGNSVISGNVSAVDATFSGNVSIGGTLTYEDVTNVDSVGLLTARSGIKVLAGGADIVGVVTATGADINGDLDVDGHTNLDNVSIVGVTTFTGNIDADGDLDVDGHTNLDNVSVSGVSTFAGNIDADGDLDVDGHTNLDNLSVSGVSTFAGNIDANGDLDVDGHTNLDNVSIAGIVTGIAGENKLPSLYSSLVALPNSSDYHGMFAHVHSTGKAYYSHDMGSTITVTVGQDNVSGQSTGVFYFNGTEKPAHFVLNRNTTYIFDQSHSSNANYGSAGAHPLMFSTGPGGDHNGNGHYMSGVTYKLDGVVKTMMQYTNGFTSATSRTVEWKIPADAPLTLYYWCHHHTGQGNSFALYDGGWTELVNKNKFGVTGLGTETYNIGILTATQLEVNGDADFSGITELYHMSVLGVSTFAAAVDINSDLDVDGHTELDNVRISGVTTTTGHILPEVDNTYDLGSSTKYWRSVYAHNITGGGGGVTLGDDIITRNLKVNGISTFVGASIFNGTITANDNVDLNADLDVDGHTNLDNVSVAGVTTFAANTRLSGTLAVHDGTTGSNGQYLKSIGTGVTWATFPTMRTRDTITASAGQTSFSFNYTVNFIDVFVNGIKLTDSEFTATNGTTVVLAVGCFVGDIVELVSYNTVSTGAGGGGGSLNNVVEDTSPQLGANLDLFGKTIDGTGGINMTGVVTATSFVGNGSGLTGVVASGSGVVVKNSGSTVGTAGTIDFGTNLSVTPASAGIVTVTAGINTSQFNVNKLHVSGITTFTGITTYTESVHFRGGNYKEVWFWAHPNLPQNHMVWKSWVAGGTGGLFIPKSTIYLGENSRSQIDPHGSGSAGHLRIEQYMDEGNNPLQIHSDFTHIKGSPTAGHESRKIADFEFAEGTSLYFLGNKKFQTCGVGVTVYGKQFITGDLDVDGHTELDNVNVAGVVTATTLKGALEATSGSFTSTLDTVGINASGEINLDTHPARIKSSAGDLEIGVGTTSSFFIKGGPYTAERFEATVDCCILYSAGTKVARTHNGRFEIGNPAAAVGIGATFNTNGNAVIAGITTIGGQSTFKGIVNIMDGLRLQTNGNLTIIDSTTSSGIDIQSNASIQLSQNGFPNNEYAVFSNGGATFYRGGNATLNDIASGWDFYNHITANQGSQYDIGTNSKRFRTGYFDTVSAGSSVSVGTGVTIESNGQATYTGIVTAQKFVGDGSSLTGISGSGGVAVQDEGSTLSTQAATLNFVGTGVAASGSGTTKTITINAGTADTTDIRTNTLEVVGVSTFAGITTVTGNTLFTKQLSVSGVSTFQNASSYSLTVGAGNLVVNGNSIYGSSKVIIMGGGGSDTQYYSGGTSYSDHIFKTLQGGSQIERFRIGKDGDIGLLGENYGTSGQVLTSGGAGSAVSWTTISAGTDVGITTNLTGSFTATAGSPIGINTTAYSTNDTVIEYTVFVQNGSNIQTQKVLASRVGPVIYYTNYAIHYSSSLLVQCNVIRSGGNNFVLRVVPETGVSGTITHKVKREVM